MITLDDYFGNWRPMASAEHEGNAATLIDKVNRLMDLAFIDGIDFDLNPKTNSYVSGEKYGGYRPADCAVGAPASSHKEGKAVDVYDRNGDFGRWCLAHQDHLQKLGLHMEHPQATPVWCHLTTRPPRSGKVAFLP